MDIGQTYINGGAIVESLPPTRPFARPRQKRRRVAPLKPTLFAVRPNPSHYLLDFSEHAKSVEHAVSSLLQSDIRTVAVVGLPGSGKTVVLRGVAYHPSVYSYFPDGICLVQTGVVPVDTVFSHFCEIIDRMRGVECVEKVNAFLNDGKHTAAMDLVSNFLKEKRFLLILDNVSESNPEVMKLLLQLIPSKSSRGTGRFTVLTSTRNVDTARQFGGNSVLHLHLHEACGSTSRNILCAHAGFAREYFDNACRTTESAALSVLKKCSGLPLALAIAGGAIKRLLKDTETTGAKDQIWVQYKSYLFDNFDQFGDISGLFKALTDCRKSVEKDWKAGIGVMDVVCSLSVAKHGVWIPFQVLQRLWGMRKKDDIALVVRPLSRVCLISRELRRGSAGISIPGIVIDYCAHVAKQTCDVHKWHVKLLWSYSGMHGKKTNGVKKAQEEVSVMNTSFDEDQYLQETLVYHLTKAVETSGGDKQEEARLKAAVEVIQNRIAHKYEMRRQNLGNGR